MASLPDYFQDGETPAEKWFMVGDAIYGVLTIDGNKVSYKVRGLGEAQLTVKIFRDNEMAIAFAVAFAECMRRYGQFNLIPSSINFQRFSNY